MYSLDTFPFLSNIARYNTGPSSHALALTCKQTLSECLAESEFHGHQEIKNILFRCNKATDHLQPLREYNGLPLDEKQVRLYLDLTEAVNLECLAAAESLIDCICVDKWFFRYVFDANLQSGNFIPIQYDQEVAVEDAAYRTEFKLSDDAQIYRQMRVKEQKAMFLIHRYKEYTAPIFTSLQLFPNMTKVEIRIVGLPEETYPFVRDTIYIICGYVARSAHPTLDEAYVYTGNDLRETLLRHPLHGLMTSNQWLELSQYREWDAETIARIKDRMVTARRLREEKQAGVKRKAEEELVAGRKSKRGQDIDGETGRDGEPVP